MALNQRNRPRPPSISVDRTVLAALRELSDYQPLNQAYATAILAQLEENLAMAEQAEDRARRALDQARSVRAAAAAAFHEAIRGAKEQVIAQYGADSLAVQAIGLTRRSQRKRPSRRTPSPAQ